MSEKNKKQFGVWMDTHHAIVVGRENTDEGAFVILAHENADVKEGITKDRTGSNVENNTQHKFFKAIASHMQNVDEIHVTGTGVAQEQFIKYLGNTPQYKNAVATESTSNKMSNENLVEYVSGKFK